MTIKPIILTLLLAGASAVYCAADDPVDGVKAADTSAHQPERKNPYVPTADNLAAREAFADAGLGIFIHWGIYSMFGQGEWYLQNCGMDRNEYAKAAGGFYPARFDAAEWVRVFKDAGAKYVTITSRHHDGFSMFHTALSPYNIVDATPYGRDVIKELADECAKEGIKLHFYYSHIDWTRDDYPMGRTGTRTGKDPAKADWPGYYRFMNGQLEELLTNYGPVGAIWFDGLWDRDQDSIPFDWQLEEQYDMIHRLQPGCLIANNHHCDIIPGEDIQVFERDLPGENTAGYSEQAISTEIPLETCQTVSASWGYRATDNNFKDVKTLVHLLVGAAGNGGNLLLNVGPRPSGELPEEAVDRLHGLGEWLRANGETVYGTRRGDFATQTWGTSTRKGNKLYVHVLRPEGPEITVPTKRKVKSAKLYATGEPVKYKKTPDGVVLLLDELPDVPDHIVELLTD